MSKPFHLGDVLSVTTDKLLSPRLMDGVYDILNFMTGDSLYTHQLPRAQRECRPWLLRQHPQLAELDTSGVNQTTWRAWLDEQIARFGEHLEVEPIPRDDHAVKDPLTELREMMPGKPIVVIDAREIP